MNLNFNTWHPMPRYGLAAAIVDYEREHKGNFPELTAPELARMAIASLALNKRGYLLRTVPNRDGGANSVRYQDFNEVEKLRPGKPAKQNSANGFFLAPHVLTSNDSGKMVNEFAALTNALKGPLDKSFQLKRSFSPMTSKTNAGRGTMSDPKDELLQAAFTAVASSTKRKAAALDYDNYTNIGLIPDLPLVTEDGTEYPLVEYVHILELIQKNLGDVRIGTKDLKTNKYGPRPAYYRGNFQYALSNVNFGSLQLLAALSRLMEEGQAIRPERVQRLIGYMEHRPLHIIGYDSGRQEQFGSHLTELTRNGILYHMLNDIWKVDFYDIKDNKYKDPKWKHFKRNLDRWLRRFDWPSFIAFLSVRATYPISFLQPIKYFMSQKISEEIIDSALALGKSINYAAFKSAQEKKKADKATARTVFDYKTRVLASLESNIRSARQPEQLLAQISTQIGRMTNYDVDGKAEAFMRAILTEELDLKQGQNLLIAFMRLNQSYDRAVAESEKSTDESEFTT
ncbi:hypothetical protein [Neolewinella antarctica]|uniref:Uncharacterized protein n=1 Tax=Neolewinella antarctica TaxID=442734 RepID=A0ABX0X8V9_9BACT|nr:hypothetical protein [Neolewinella antarctica]NJC25690.1 hypothetical protein [Neolewinella antarctica]